MSFGLAAATQAARLLAQARQTGARLHALPDALRPRSEALSTAIQKALIAELGGVIGGWKVGAQDPRATPSCAPLPAASLHASPARLASLAFPQREVESEIAFIIGQDLPPREAPYATAELAAAIASCHPAIEVLQSAFAEPAAAGAASLLADLIQHGALIHGAPIGGWRDIDFSGLRVVQTIGDAQARTSTGNPAGDMMRLLLWLANTGAFWAGGLKAGQIVTCGSWTGKTRAPAGATATTRFGHAAPVVLQFV